MVGGASLKRHTFYPTAPSSLIKGSLKTAAATDPNSRVKSYQTGEIKLHGETQTAKLIVKGLNVDSPYITGRNPDLNCRTFTLRNLIRIICHNRTFVEYGNRAIALSPSILSLVSMLFNKDNEIPHRVETTYAENLIQGTLIRNFGITYGNEINLIPKNTP